MRFPTNYVDEKDDSVILLIGSVIVAIIALYITAGLQHFAWVVFTLYAVFIFAGAFFLSSYIFKGNHILYTFASILIGSAAGILFVAKVILPYW